MVKNRWREVADDALFMVPAVALFAAITVGSFVLGIFYSFTDWNGVSLIPEWVGLANFRTIFTDDPQVGHSAWFTLRFTVTVVVVANLLGLALALILTQPMRFSRIYRVVFFLPNIIGGIILGFVWRFIFTNAVPRLAEVVPVGILQLPWLGDAQTGFWAAVIVFTWKSAGYLMVVYIAAIVSINEELLEAARIDGVSFWQMLMRIIVPLIVPAFTVCLFLMLSWSMKIFDVLFSLTQGGPYKSTESSALNIYYEAFQYNNYGLGSAKAILFFVVVGLVTLIQVSFTKRLELES